MLGTKKTGLLVVLFLLFLTVGAAIKVPFTFAQAPSLLDTEPVGEDVIDNQQYDQLSAFLDEMGYRTHEGKVVSSHIDDLIFENGVEVEVDMNVELISFFNDDGSHATIAVWSGQWEHGFYKGAVATLDGTEIYGVVGSGVRELKNIEEYMEFPLYALVGPTPLGATERTEKEQTEEVSLTTSCTTVHRSTTAYSFLGAKMYTYAMDKYFCFDGDSVFNINVNTYLAYSDGLHSYQGDIGSTDYYKNGTSSHYSFRQGHIKKCIIEYGCIADLYPWIWIETFKNGHVTSGSYSGV